MTKRQMSRSGDEKELQLEQRRWEEDGSLDRRNEDWRCALKLAYCTLEVAGVLREDPPLPMFAIGLHVYTHLDSYDPVMDLRRGRVQSLRRER